MIYIIISFFLDGILSNYLKPPFLPLFTLCSIILIKPYIKNDGSSHQYIKETYKVHIKQNTIAKFVLYTPNPDESSFFLPL